MIDLHTHSTASDGTLSPGGLVELAAAKGLTALALTDHDTVAGIAEATERAGQLKLEFIPGIELSASRNGVQEVHILGYYIEPESPRLADVCAWLNRCRWLRAERMVARLNRIGVAVSWEQVAAQVTSGSVGRPHVARAVVEAGYAKTLKQAFQRWLVPGAPAFVEKERPSAREAIQTIRHASGFAVLAHPAKLIRSPSELATFVAELASCGLAGIEAYWSRHTEKELRLCEELARRHELVVTGGSDFHGSNKPGVEIGQGPGNRVLERKMLEALEERCRDLARRARSPQGRGETRAWVPPTTG